MGRGAGLVEVGRGARVGAGRAVARAVDRVWRGTGTTTRGRGGAAAVVAGAERGAVVPPAVVRAVVVRGGEVGVPDEAATVRAAVEVEAAPLSPRSTPEDSEEAVPPCSSGRTEPRATSPASAVAGTQ